VARGAWAGVAELRIILEKTLEAEAKTTILVRKGDPRLPNPSCILTPGWKGETQVMQMDLAGFAVSACSSGKVRASHVLSAMGYGEELAASAIRVSLGLETTEEKIMRFAETWLAKREKHQTRAA
jgi:cysteine desulfurase